jgi:chromosome segregation ATPase
MNAERLQMQGRLAEEKSKRHDIELEMRGLITQIRAQLDPLAEPYDIEADEVHVASRRLAELHAQLRALQEKIDRIERYLE